MQTSAYALLFMIASFTGSSSRVIPSITRGPDTRHFALMIKTTFRHFPRRIASDASNFTYLVTYSDLFFDKTLILNELFKARHKTIGIELPRKWGKSVILHMIKTFLEIQVDHTNTRVPHEESSNYALFKEAIIHEPNGQVQKFEEHFLVTRKYPKYLESHCAQFPVIFLEFKPIKVTSENRMYEEVAACISEAYKRHHYIVDILNGTAKQWPVALEIQREEGQNYLEYYRKFSERQANTTELTDSLFLLTKMLHRVYNKTVFVLIDDYDVVLNYVEPSPQQVRNHVLKFLQRFYATLLSHSFNDNPYLEKAIMIGTFRMEKLLPQLDKFTLYKGSSTVIFRLAGFTVTEVNTLFSYLEIPKKIENKAKDWYGGYKKNFGDLTNLLSPGSVANFVNTRKIQNHRLPPDNFFVRNLLKNERMRTFMMGMLDSKLLEFQYKAVTYEDLVLFQQIIYRPHKHLRIYMKTYHQVYGYLMDSGYFKLYDNLQNYGYCVVLANEEIRNEILTEMLDFYAPIYNISMNQLENAVHSLAHFVNSDDRQSKNLTDTLQPLIGGSRSQIARLVIHLLVSKITMSYDLRCKEISHDVADIKPNGILYSNEYGAVIHVALNSTSIEDAMLEARQFEDEVKVIKSVKNVKFITINVPSTGALDIRAETHLVDTPY